MSSNSMISNLNIRGKLYRGDTNRRSYESNRLDSLRLKQLATIESAGLVLHGVDVSEFEKAGGSLRCLVTEIF